MTCEAFDKLGDSKIEFKGFITAQTDDHVTVCVPTAQNTKHKFNKLDDGQGYGHEGSAFAPRGWRISLKQLNEPTDAA